jgi:2,3-bisphosphoglycerate-independent phosphoglycerate mutase
MDRDNRWDRIEKAYRAMVEGVAERTSVQALKAIKNAYAEKNFDEEFFPVVITKGKKPVTTIEENDAVVYFNFRPDRGRQLTEAFALPAFSKFKRTHLKNLFFVTLAEYEKNLPVVVAYPPVIIHNSLAEVLSKNGLKQLHIAETEKYAHITYFLNGMIEDSFPGEERVLVPSPLVANYATTPAMSLERITQEVVEALDKKRFDFIAVNFANADMVGHTGDKQATIEACEAIDKALRQISEHAMAQRGVVVVTADHGNAEEVLNLQTGGIDKEHSTNPVPFMIIGKDFIGQAGSGGDPLDGDLSLLSPVGILADVAPTILKLLGVSQPEEMIGRSLV